AGARPRASTLCLLSVRGRATPMSGPGAGAAGAASNCRVGSPDLPPAPRPGLPSLASTGSHTPALPHPLVYGGAPDTAPTVWPVNRPGMELCTCSVLIRREMPYTVPSLGSNNSFQESWLFRCVISASIHGHIRPMPHESTLSSMDYAHGGQDKG